MSKVIRGVKNVAKGYNSTQVKVRNGAAVPIRLPVATNDRMQLRRMIPRVPQRRRCLRFRRLL